VNLEKELSLKFAKILDLKSANFDSVYVIATLLDPKFVALLKDEVLDSAKQGIKCLVSVKYHWNI